jgi:hypothetical protein
VTPEPVLGSGNDVVPTVRLLMAIVSAIPATGPAERHRLWARREGRPLIGLALAAFVLLAGVLAVDVAALAASRAAAQTAADMAALAALTPQAGWDTEIGRSSASVFEGGRGQVRAAEIATANGAELVACTCSTVEAIVTVRRRVALAPGVVTVSLTARARAVLAAPRPRGRS